MRDKKKNWGRETRDRDNFLSTKNDLTSHTIYHEKIKLLAKHEFNTYAHRS